MEGCNHVHILWNLTFLVRKCGIGGDGPACFTQHFNLPKLEKHNQ